LPCGSGIEGFLQSGNFQGYSSAPENCGRILKMSQDARRSWMGIYRVFSDASCLNWTTRFS